VFRTALVTLLTVGLASSSCRLKADDSGDADVTDGTPAAPTITPTPVSASPPCLTAPGSFAEIASRLSPNIVTILGTADEERGSSGPSVALPLVWPSSSSQATTGAESEATFLGTGFLLRADAVVITSHHVVGSTSPLTVLLHDDQIVSATIRGADPDLDLAILSLEEPVDDAMTLSNCSRISPGDWIAVLSNPFGSETTVTAGVVRFTTAPEDQLPSHHLLRRFLGVDATIDAANWGGLVVDTGGRVVGLAIAASRAGSEVGVVLPAPTLRRHVDQLVRHGHPGRTWIGLWVRPLERDQAVALGIDPPSGLLVTRVAPTGPAQEAGVESDDIILEVSGQAVSSASALGAIAARVDAGQSVPMVVLRDGRPRTLRLRPAPMPQ
jgi:S1-C subfamily serine protease